MRTRYKIGIIGCGAIGSQLARALDRKADAALKLTVLTDVMTDKASLVAQTLKTKVPVCPLAAAVEKSDLLIEAAGMKAVPAIAREVLKQKKDLLLLSVGALVVYPDLLKRFGKSKSRLHYPSGAIAGLDALKGAMAMGKIKSVNLATRKPPRGLAGAPFFKQHNLDPLKLKKATTIFSGTARQAIRLFPANVNVAAALSLTGIGADKTRVELIADPKAKRNTHTITVLGDFGSFTTVTENVPSKDNPKTSFLAAASALATIKAIVRGNRQGT